MRHDDDNVPELDPISFSGYALVEVKWVDSAETVPNEEIEFDELPRPQVKLSAGYLLSEEPEYLVIAGIVNTHQTADYVIAIPKVAIQEIRRWTE